MIILITGLENLGMMKMARKLDFVNGLVRRLTGTEKEKEDDDENKSGDKDEVRIQ